MKRVFTNSDDVIHLFAQQSQYDARCGNVFFEGNKIYSYGYHYCLGEFLDENTIMINDNSPSVTTSKHVRQLEWASRQYKQFFVSETNLDIVKNQIDWNVKKLITARKPELYLKPIFRLWGKLNEYLKYKRTLTKVKKNDYRYKHIQKIVKKLHDDYDDYITKLQEYKKQAEQNRNFSKC